MNRKNVLEFISRFLGLLAASAALTLFAGILPAAAADFPESSAQCDNLSNCVINDHYLVQPDGRTYTLAGVSTNDIPAARYNPVTVSQKPFLGTCDPIFPNCINSNTAANQVSYVSKSGAPCGSTDYFVYYQTYGIRSNLAKAYFHYCYLPTPPVAKADNYYGYSGATYVGNVKANDEYAIVATAVLVSQDQVGQLTLNSNGDFFWTIPSGYAGSPTFTYKLVNGDLVSGTTTVTLNVSIGANFASGTCTVGRRDSVGISIALSNPACAVISLENDIYDLGILSGQLTINRPVVLEGELDQGGRQLTTIKLGLNTSIYLRDIKVNAENVTIRNLSFENAGIFVDRNSSVSAGKNLNVIHNQFANNIVEEAQAISGYFIAVDGAGNDFSGAPLENINIVDNKFNYYSTISLAHAIVFRAAYLKNTNIQNNYFHGPFHKVLYDSSGAMTPSTTNVFASNDVFIIGGIGSAVVIDGDRSWKIDHNQFQALGYVTGPVVRCMSEWSCASVDENVFIGGPWSSAGIKFSFGNHVVTGNRFIETGMMPRYAIEGAYAVLKAVIPCEEWEADYKSKWMSPRVTPSYPDSNPIAVAYELPSCDVHPPVSPTGAIATFTREYIEFNFGSTPRSSPEFDDIESHEVYYSLVSQPTSPADGTLLQGSSLCRYNALPAIMYDGQRPPGKLGWGEACARWLPRSIVSPGQKVYFSVFAKDRAGNYSAPVQVSGNYDPLQDVMLTKTSDSTATVTWKTNELTSSNYITGSGIQPRFQNCTLIGNTAPYDVRYDCVDTPLTTEHSVDLSGITSWGDLAHVFILSWNQEKDIVSVNFSDYDRDQVEGEYDNCPAEAGIRSSDISYNGCPDTDGDGVFDFHYVYSGTSVIKVNVDACPMVSGVPTNDSATNGCPVNPDTDDDGVLDNVDQCPAVAGQAAWQGCPAAAVSNVTLNTVYEGAGKLPPAKAPLSGAEVRVFDLNSAEMVSVYGNGGPNSSQYAAVFEGMSPVGSCVTADSGSCAAGVPAAGNYLTVVKFSDSAAGLVVYTGQAYPPASFSGGSVSKDFNVIKLVKDGVLKEYRGGQVKTFAGSYLEIIEADSAVWNGTTSYYPFIMTSDSEWVVDVCTSVPAGYVVAGYYDAAGDLQPQDCASVTVNNETKTLVFEAVDVGSPEPSAEFGFTLRHQGKVQKHSWKVNDLRKPAFEKMVGEAKGAEKNAVEGKKQSLKAGDSLWKVVESWAASNRVSRPVLWLAKEAARANQVDVPEWNIKGVRNARAISPGTKLDLSPLLKWLSSR